MITSTARIIRYFKFLRKNIIAPRTIRMIRIGITYGATMEMSESMLGMETMMLDPGYANSEKRVIERATPKHGLP